MLPDTLNFIVQPSAAYAANRDWSCALRVSPGVSARPWKSVVLALSPKRKLARRIFLSHAGRCNAGPVPDNDADIAPVMGTSKTHNTKNETKRRRGRPVGSKSKFPRAKKSKDAEEPRPETALEARSGTSSSTFVNMQEVLSLPNGLKGEGQPANFLAELLPRIAKRDAQESVSGLSDLGEEYRQQTLYQVIKNKYLSNFRGSESYKHLKPFQLKADTVQKCSTCNATGMMQCDCCKGAGMMDESVTGPPGTLYKYVGGEAIVPEFNGLIGEVVCPFCGGMTVERCLQCLGSGKVPVEGSDEHPAGAANTAGIEVAYEWASREDFLHEYADRIEIGVDGTTILRRRKRARRKKCEVSASKENASEDAASRDASSSNSVLGPRPIVAVGPYCELPWRRRRGRPRKGETMDDLFPLLDPALSTESEVIRGRFKTVRPQVASSARGNGNQLASSDLRDFPESFARVKYEKVVAAMKNRTFSDLLNQLVANEGTSASRDE
jgi:hypothetical protein